MYMCLAVYEFWIMMDRQAESKEHNTVYAAAPNISIHLLIMQLLRQREALGHFLTSQWILGDLSCGVRVQAPTPDDRPSWYFCLFISVSSSFLLTSRLMSHFWLEMLFYRWWTCWCDWSALVYHLLHHLQWGVASLTVSQRWNDVL